MSSDCLVCREVAGEVELPGGFLLEDEDAVAFHVPPTELRPGLWPGHYEPKALSACTSQ